MPKVEIKRKSRLTRQEVSERLIALGNALADGSEIRLDRPWNAAEYPGDAFFTFRSAELPDAWDTVVELVLKDE